VLFERAGLISDSMKHQFSFLSWSFASGAWAGVVVLFSTPILLRNYGLDGFGLIGLWTTLQVVLNLFDFGLSATLGRQFARSLAARTDWKSSVDLLVTCERSVWLFSAMLFIAAFFGARVDFNLVRSDVIAIEDLSVILFLLCASLALQFPTILYSGGITGLQRHPQLSMSQIVVNGIRWLGGCALAVNGAPIHYFFVLQGVVSLGQALVLRLIAYLALQEHPRGVFSWSVLRHHRSFAIGMAGTSVLSAVVANSDRIIISQMLSAGDLGVYSVAFIACGVIQMIVIPFYRVYYPRFSMLFSKGDLRDLRTEYLSSTRLLSLLVVPTTICVAAFSREIIEAWIISPDKRIADVLRVLVFGVGMASVSWLCGALQQASGWTSLHSSMLLLSIAVGVPVAMFGITYFGLIGAASVWVVHGVISLLIEPIFMHRRLLKTELLYWYTLAVFSPCLATCVVIWASSSFQPKCLSGWGLLGWVIATAASSVAMAAVLQSWVIKLQGHRINEKQG
jgi:O-antigen/teichoic acid export membrane protein